jgi:hypothetical protein
MVDSIIASVGWIAFYSIRHYHRHAIESTLAPGLAAEIFKRRNAGETNVGKYLSISQIAELSAYSLSVYYYVPGTRKIVKVTEARIDARNFTSLMRNKQVHYPFNPFWVCGRDIHTDSADFRDVMTASKILRPRVDRANNLCQKCQKMMSVVLYDSINFCVPCIYSTSTPPSSK